MEKVAAIVLAGGSGKRMGTKTKKQYLKLQNKEILAHTLTKFNELEVIDEIIIVTSAEDIGYVKKEICQRYSIDKVVNIVEGGAERQDSVYNGLQVVGEATYVVIHDGARPFVTKEEVELCLQKAKTDGAAILGVPVKDTIKQVGEGSEVVGTPDRKTLWAVQTPQIFKKNIVKEAYEYAKDNNIQGTDDSSLVEELSKKVYIVEGQYTNIKITTPEDLVLGERILEII